MAEPNSPKPVMQAVGERIKRASLEKLANFKVVCVPLLAYLSQWMERYCERERERERGTLGITHIGTPRMSRKRK